MAIKVLLFLFFSLFLFISPAKVSATDKFINLVYPVRSRDLWQENKLSHLDNAFKELRDRKLKSTWLLQYDTLKDTDLINKVEKDCPKCELGLFLEVSEVLATDANVSFKIGEGHWYRPDKIFLSGYSLLEREKLIDKQFEKFKAIFGHYPISVGVWYIDPFSLNYLVDKYNVSGFVSVADQYDTDGQRYWGKPFGSPYYPQKLNALAPANSLDNKLNIVGIQWAQRHPTDSLGVGPHFSQFSLQANDYKNNKKDTAYFENLADLYLDNPNNPSPQITVGLEVGQELQVFWDEHLKQLDYIVKKEGTTVLTMSEFSSWYKETIPGVSPKNSITDGTTTWVNNPCFRAAYKNGKPFDIRSYDDSNVSPDVFGPDADHFIDREIIEVSKIPNCSTNFNTRVYGLKIMMKLMSEKLLQPLLILKWSNINGSKVIGLQLGKEQIFGYWAGKGIGTYHFPFQTLSKFRSVR